MSGTFEKSMCREAQIDTYKKNLFYASKKLNEVGLIGIIEPICSAAIPNYLMNNYDLGK